MDRPMWCGSCDRRTRLLLVDAGTPTERMVRCELCSPIDGRGGCGKHVQPPGRACALCVAGIPGRSDQGEVSGTE